MAGVTKWAAGVQYGPVLSQTDLYLLSTSQNVSLELHPILEGKSQDQHLQFHLVSARGANGVVDSILSKEEPATLPRCSQLIIISRLSPWCTIIKKETGVTIGDLCTALFKDYTEHDITDPEFASLPPRVQEHVKRVAQQNFQSTQPQSAQSNWGYYPPAGPDRIKRVDWLRERVFFEGLSRDDNYAKSRLGFKAPNVFVMELTS